MALWQPDDPWGSAPPLVSPCLAAIALAIGLALASCAPLCPAHERDDLMQVDLGAHDWEAGLPSLATLRREPYTWPAGAPEPWSDGSEVSDLILSQVVRYIDHQVFSGEIRDGDGVGGDDGHLALTVSGALRQDLTGTYSATGPLTLGPGGTLVTVPPTGVTQVYAQAHGRLYVTASWSPPAGTALSFEGGATPGLIVIAGTLTTPVGGTLSVTSQVPELPHTLVYATSLSGTWTAGTLPSGTHLSQTGGQIRLEAD